MLALTRKTDEAIIVNGNIEIRVLDITDGKVRIGINAPKDVSIHREEVYKELQETNKTATTNPQEKQQHISKVL
jgi:carbon storage regulator